MTGMLAKSKGNTTGFYTKQATYNVIGQQGHLVKRTVRGDISDNYGVIESSNLINENKFGYNIINWKT